MFHNDIPFFTGFRGRRLTKSLDQHHWPQPKEGPNGELK